MKTALVLGMLIALAWLPGVFILFPEIESRLHPVTSFEGSTATLAEGRLSLVLAGHKFRPCLLRTTSFTWLGPDNIIEPATIYLPNGEPFQATPSRTAGQDWVARNLSSELPDRMLAFKQVKFQVTLYYECHIGYPIEQSVSFDLDVR